MSNESAKELVRRTFQSSFDKIRYHLFIKELLNHIDDSEADRFICQGQYVPEAYRQYIKSYERIAKYSDAEGNKIDILIVYLQRERSLEMARSMQRNFIARYLNGGRGGILRDAALVAFVSPNGEDWRFSLVKMEYKFTETVEGRVKVKEVFTPARRWSFLVGVHENSHTAQSRLASIIADDEHNPGLKQLEEAFNIEKVTKEFFEKYRELVIWVMEELDAQVNANEAIRAEFSAKNINTIDFAKKLLGQIVFLYFLQKKGWFGVQRDKEWGSGSKNFLRELFEKKHGGYANFFNDVLEPLFYEALAREREQDFYSRFNCKIPFLNGGLFDPVNNYDWVHTDILLPNEIFSNQNKTKEGDVGNGILNIFDRYNFTVKEDEPLEKEVAIDPEMLGKVFENLLEVKDRKSRGTYYTPREIVHYMCQQSLIYYLYTELNQDPSTHERAGDEQFNLLGNEGKQGQLDITLEHQPGPAISKEDIEIFIKYCEQSSEHDARVAERGEETGAYQFMMPVSILNNAKLADEKLAEIKVCDPAVGSGAFLVGMMTEIIRARQYLSQQIGKQYRTRYELKRLCIEQSLYGVDIDPSAVEIAKLRLWLSLIVDEEEYKRIKPLPNLDYKVVCGNSLLGVEINVFNQQLFADLELLKPVYFDETDPVRKQRHKKQIDALIDKITTGSKEFDFKIYFSEVFHQGRGFDIVITNPPYVGEKSHKELFREIKKHDLGVFYMGKMDLFYFFFHLALNIGKDLSQIAFITTNYYPTASGARKLRQDFKKRAVLRRLINFNELKIFESALGQHNMVSLLSKCNQKDEIANTCITRRTGFASNMELEKILGWQDEKTDYFKVSQNDLYDGDEFYIRITGNKINSRDPSQTILEKIKTQGNPLGLFCHVNQGIVTGADKVTKKHIEKHTINAKIGDGIFVLSSQEIEKLNLSPKEKIILKPWFKNSAIHRYYTEDLTDEFVIYAVKNIVNLKENRINKNHLQKYLNVIDDSSDNSPYLHRPRSIDWESMKIVAPQRSHINTFGFNKIPWYASADVYFITSKDTSINLKYFLAILNSKLIYFWLYHRGKRKGESLELYQVPLSEIPIKKVNKEEQEPFVQIVDQILTRKEKNKNADIQDLENKIDQMVYQFYGLTEEEIKVVESYQKELLK